MDDNKFYFYAKLIIAGLTIVMIFSLKQMTLSYQETGCYWTVSHDTSYTLTQRHAPTAP